MDETRLAFVNTKVAGWVKKLYIDYTGQKAVKRAAAALDLRVRTWSRPRKSTSLRSAPRAPATAPGGFSEGCRIAAVAH